MVKYYKTWRKGMKKAKSGKYYYPKRNQVKSKPAMVRARAPIVETKKNTEALVVERLKDSSFSHFIPVSSFIRMNQGRETDQFIGDSVFSKYISMKLNFVFPSGANAIIKPYRIQVIHGWMTSPFALDPNGGSTFSSEHVSRAQLDQIVAARCGGEFNQAVDRMNFRDKTKKIYRVEGKKWITVNRNAAINDTILSQGLTGHGGPPNSFMQLNWKPMRKINLTYSTDSNSTATPDPFHYCNEAWVPFVCVYTPDKDNLNNPEPPGTPTPAESQVLLQAMNCHWYTDS